MNGREENDELRTKRFGKGGGNLRGWNQGGEDIGREDFRKGRAG